MMKAKIKNLKIVRDLDLDIGFRNYGLHRENDLCTFSVFEIGLWKQPNSIDPN